MSTDILLVRAGRGLVTTKGETIGLSCTSYFTFGRVRFLSLREQRDICLRTLHVPPLRIDLNGMHEEPRGQRRRRMGRKGAWYISRRGEERRCNTQCSRHCHTLLIEGDICMTLAQGQLKQANPHIGKQVDTVKHATNSAKQELVAAPGMYCLVWSGKIRPYGAKLSACSEWECVPSFYG